MKVKKLKTKGGRKEKRLLEIIIENPVVRDYFLIFSKIFAVLGTIFFVIAFAPSVYFNTLGLFGLNRSNQFLSDSAMNLNPISITKFENYVYQPEFDETLPENNVLVIPGTRINTNINEALDKDHEDALRLGVWRVSTFGTPYQRNYPTILVAHRYGYLKWTVAYRLKNSFYELPKAQVGQKIEILWQQRKYVYEIYKKEEGQQISDYTADLILYTCRDLNNDVKIVVYSRLLEV